MKLLKCIGFLAILFFTFVASAQNVSVNNFTGTASVVIPLHNIQSGAVSMPVMLVYSGTGIRVKDVEGSAGIGWNLVAGGEISRQLRGLPDDSKKDNDPAGAKTRKGWLYANTRTKINNLSLANDNSSSNCTDETTDLSYIAGNFQDSLDTEPDVFMVNAPGLSCKLVFDKDLNIRTIPYQDIKVTYTVEPSGVSKEGRINSFTITTDKGITYQFSDREVTTRTAINPSSPVDYFKHEYDQYKNGIDYVSAWKLTRISDINSNSIVVVYDNAGNTTANTKIAFSSGTSSTVVYPFTYQVWTTPKVLQYIYYHNGDELMSVDRRLEFTYTSSPGSGTALVNGIIGKGQTISLSYSNVTSSLGTAPIKMFLKNVNMLPNLNFQMDYYGVALGNTFTVALPDSSSKAIDLWGYYNGSSATTLLPQTYINPSGGVVGSAAERYRHIAPVNNSSNYPYVISGADRSVNPATITNGSLKNISYSYGGTKTFTYEPNDYYDVTSGSVIKGGGIRIKEITTSDSINLAGNMVETYNYTNPSTGLSSGKPVSLPLLAFTKPYAGSGTLESQWQNSTVRLEESLSPEDQTIIYSHVKISRSGAGSTQYEYSTPATFWDLTASPDWSPTVVNVGRISCVAGGFTTNQTNTYPFINNPNFEFERGLVKQVTQKNETGQVVNEATYSYNRTGSPALVWGLKFDNNNSTTGYAKYPVLTGTDQLMTNVTSKVYDLPSLSTYKQTSVTNAYASSQHKQLTSQQTTNSDGSTLTVYNKYVKDYTAAASADSMSTAVYNLQQLNFNVPVETYTQVTRGAITKTIAASLMKFKAFTFGANNRYLPSQTLAFNSNSGVTDFQPATIVSNVFSRDSRYIVTSNNTHYSENGFLLTSNDNRHNVRTTVTDYDVSKPVAQISGATIEEVAFNNFDTRDMVATFTSAAPDVLSSTSRSGKSAVSLTNGLLYSAIVKKNPRAQFYIFSIWAAASSSGNITLTLVNSGNTPYSYTLPYTNTDAEWKYLELKVPLTGMTTSFTAKFSSSTDIIIDDVWFYPDVADVASFAYNLATSQTTTETNGAGQSKYSEYDAAGRLRYIRDQDRNIVYKRSYYKAGSDSDYQVGISAGGNNYYSQTAFTDNKYSSETNNEGLSYTWNFGDGSPEVTTRNYAGSTNHVYNAAGTYTVTLTKSSPVYGTKTATQSVTMVAGNPNSQLVAVSAGTPGITQLDFYHGSTLTLTYNSTQLAAGNVSAPADISKVRFTVSNVYHSVNNPTGVKSVLISGTGPYRSVNMCIPVNGPTTGYFVDIDLTGLTNLGFSVSYDGCSLPVE